MLELDAASFYSVTTALGTLSNLVERKFLSSYEEGESGGLKIAFENDPIMIRKLVDIVDDLQEHLKVLGATFTLRSAVKLKDAINAEPGFTWEAVGELLSDIDRRLVEELEDTKVIVLDRSEAALFAPPEPIFGAEFAAKFPTEGAFELDEAAKCLAVGRPTAAVFHLMRLMEVGIRAISSCLGIPPPTKPAERNWGVLLEQKIWKDGIQRRWPIPAERLHGDGQFFEALYASLDAVKHPWRNATMHVEAKYTDDEARHILLAVRGFMKRLASRCDENGEPKA